MRSARWLLTIWIATVLCFCMRSGLEAQGPAAAAHPSLSGTWMPVDQKTSDWFFSVGLSPISGDTTVTIDQQPTRFTVTITPPDDKLDVFIRLVAPQRFYETVVYHIPLQARPGGYGAGGAPEVTVPMWVDDHFLIPDAFPGGSRRTWVSYSLKGDLLQVENSVQIENGHVNTATQLLKKAR